MYINIYVWVCQGLEATQVDSPAGEEAKAAGKKKFTMKRNLSVPALDALKQVHMHFYAYIYAYLYVMSRRIRDLFVPALDAVI